MIRSGLVLALLGLPLVAQTAPSSPAPSSPAASNQPLSSLDPVAFVQASTIKQGELRGAVRVAPGKGVNWYFANLGLLPLASSLPAAVRGHLEAYLHSTVTTDDTAADKGRYYTPDYDAKLRVQQPDSHDAYASSFLSLVRGYVEASGDLTWFKQRRAQVLNIAYYNLARQAKPSGLIRTFQTAQNGPLWEVGFTMDNAENYQGLNDLVWLLKKVGDQQNADYYARVRDGVARGLFDEQTGNWNSAAQAFFVSDRRDVLTGRFYPDAAAQVWPQLYGVKDKTTARTQARYKSAWAYFERYAPSWEIRNYDGPYPWMALGAAAALAGDKERAVKQRVFLRQQLSLGKTQLDIHDLGFDAMIGRLTR